MPVYLGVCPLVCVSTSGCDSVFLEVLCLKVSTFCVSSGLPVNVLDIRVVTVWYVPAYGLVWKVCLRVFVYL